MYRKADKAQMSIADFFMPFGGTLDENNRWVKLTELMPWDLIEDLYAENFNNDRTDGRPAYPSRIAFGAIYIKEQENLTDERTVEYISENPYMQYFLGLLEFTQKRLFDPSMMVHFRKRFPASSIAEINEELYRRTHDDNKPNDDSNKPDDGVHSGSVDENAQSNLAEPTENSGVLIVDATCAPSDIRYPQDLSLLNECRENTEAMIDILWEFTERSGHKTPYSRKKAHREYLKVAKQRKPRSSAMRNAIGKQLEYIRKSLAVIDGIPTAIVETVLSERKQQRLETIREVYNQQKQMYDEHTHSCKNRIVNLRQPHVRTIVRGKAGKRYEFGQKLEFSVVDGFTFIERQEWEPYNEGVGLINCIERFRQRFGTYPEAVLVDQIYRNKDNRAFCKKHGIRISGPRLGRPKADEHDENEKQTYSDNCARNEVEGKNGTVKRRYGLDLIMAYLQETAETEAALNVLAMNMAHCLRRLLRALYRWLDTVVLRLLCDTHARFCPFFS